MEMTSEEILSSPAIGALPREVRDRLRDLLLRADLVKFAKHRPADGENASGVPVARSFVEQTSAAHTPVPTTEVAA